VVVAIVMLLLLPEVVGIYDGRQVVVPKKEGSPSRMNTRALAFVGGATSCFFNVNTISEPLANVFFLRFFYLIQSSIDLSNYIARLSHPSWLLPVRDF